jgi:hypothetical protein
VWLEISVAQLAQVLANVDSLSQGEASTSIALSQDVMVSWLDGHDEAEQAQILANPHLQPTPEELTVLNSSLFLLSPVAQPDNGESEA